MMAYRGGGYWLAGGNSAGEEMATSDEEMYDAEKASPDHHHHHHHQPHSPSSSHHHSSHSDASMEEQPPVYIPEDVVLPPEFELRESRILEAGLGVFSLVAIPTGEKFGPFVGEERLVAKDSQYAWEIVDETGKVKCWVDASEPGTGNWMKYVRSANVLDEQNMVAVQVDNQVFYKVIRPIQAGEELMVLKEAAFPDQDGVPFEFIEEQQYSCPDCKEVFRSKVALRRHETYACKNPTTIYSNMNQQQIQNGCNNNSTMTPGAPLMPVKDTNENDEDRRDEDSKFSEDMMMSRMEESFEYSGSEQSENCETPPPGHTDMNEEDYSENRQFKCTKCPRSFNWKSNLIRHLGDHENNRYFPCENCDKSFSDPSNLQRHIRTQHVGARSHACPECGKTFATSSGLKQHTHIHSSIKPFTCEVCLKSYTQFSNLCRHKRMHADCRTQLKCSTCGQMFATITSLNKHRRFCHGSSHMMNGHQVAPPMLPIQQSLHTNGPIIGSTGVPSATSPNLMGMGVLPPTSTALHPANIAQLYNLQLKQQAALLQNNLLAYSGGEKNAAAHPYLMGYPHLAGQATPLLATGIPNGNGLLKAGGSPNNLKATEEWLKHYTASKTANKNEEHENGMSESKKLKKKLESELSDGSDIDNISTPTGSDLDSTSGSDLDSENEDGEKREKKKRKELKNGLKLDNAKEERPYLSMTDNGPSEPIKAIANIADKYFGGALPPGILPPGMVGPRLVHGHTNGIPIKIKQEHLSRSPDGAFDLTKHVAKSPPVSPVVKAARDDQPLDLSMPSKKRESDDEDMKRDTEPDAHKVPPLLVSTAEHEKALQHQLQAAYSKPMPFMDPIYRVGNGFPMMPYKFMRMDYASQEMMIQQAQAAAAFAGFRKFEPYDPSKISPVLANKPISSPPQRGFTVNNLLYPNSADKMVMRSKDRYTCKFCGKLFPRSANLTRHLRTHTGEQPYSCKYCDRSFSISSNLQRHVRNIHNKEKPFKCPLCDRCFGQQTNLDRHLKKHENERNEGTGSLSPITPIKDDLAVKLQEAKLNGVSPLPPTNLNLAEKDETYFDEIKNFINDGNSSRVSKELLPPDIRKIAPVLPRQVQSPSVGSSSPDGPKKDIEDDLAADLRQLPKLEEMETARHSPSPRPLQVDESREGSTPPPLDLAQEPMLTDSRKRTSPSPLPSPPPSPDKINQDLDADDNDEPLNKRPKLQNEIDALKSFCPSPPEESSESLDGRENLTRHSKMQAYSLMMTQYDEDHHERRRQLHGHIPSTATAV